MRKFNFDYDEENDSLFLYNPKAKSRGSIELDDLILDFDAKKDLSALELLHASRLFNDLGADFKVTRKLLTEITEARIDVTKRNSSIVIKFVILFKSKQRISSPIVVPSISAPSPAIA